MIYKIYTRAYILLLIVPFVMKRGIRCVHPCAPVGGAAKARKLAPLNKKLDATFVSSSFPTFAEREGFEPTVRIAYNGFRDRPDRPLRHLSFSA